MQQAKKEVIENKQEKEACGEADLDLELSSLQFLKRVWAEES